MSLPMNRRGFTLVELLVAAGVFVVMAMAVGGLLLTTGELSENDEETRIAALDLGTVMETINGLPFDDIVTTYPDGLSVPSFYDLNLRNETLTVSYTDPAASNPLEINLQVTWKSSQGPQKSRTLHGMRVR